MPESSDRGALTEGVYYILLSLTMPLHGYGIMQKVKELSSERVDLGAGTLYGAINTLLKREWIIPYGDGANSRKKEYVITETGLEVLKNEVIRLQELVSNGKMILQEGEK